MAAASRIDLHTHSTASDGEYRPAELVRLALSAGLEVIALTDHDSTAGIDEALEAARGTTVHVIPGVELNTDLPEREAHVLGYYIDHHNARLQAELDHSRFERVGRAQAMIERLAVMGMPLEWERVATIAGDGAVGRPHIAQAMVERGYVATMDEAFDAYIGRSGPAYVEWRRLTPVGATRLVVEAGGLPVLAHPLNVLDQVPELVKAGLVGLEIYYPGYGEDNILGLLEFARQYGLLATGGTDFHGPTRTPGVELGGVWVPPEAVKQLQERLRRIALR